ncbi:MAG: glutamine--fructose-6-phosphate transaminase (isomerizing) [Candidatus Anstonellales archaeon]
MCGIVGYVGSSKASLVILEALKNVEYRGYDSAGIAVMGSKINIIKDVGKLEEIEKKHDFSRLEGTIGIGHTRWATHGGVNAMNAHPHTDERGEVCLVHNGIIENFLELKDELLKSGCKIKSETDTELVAHLIARGLREGKGFKDAFLSAIRRIEGSFSFVVMHQGERKLYGARRSSPLVVGVGKNEMFFASDVPAFLSRTRDFVFLAEDEWAEITDSTYAIYGFDGTRIKRKPVHIEWTPQMAQKDGYPHFMLKEIVEQQNTIRAAIAADIRAAGEILTKNEIRQLFLVACGTSYHAALIFKGLLARHGIGCEAIIGSEYVADFFGKKDVVIAISQSGETADMLLAVREAKRKGAKIIGITNVVGSSLSREADACVYIGAGPEVSVVATKSFTSQLVVLYRLAWLLIKNEDCAEQLKDLSAVLGAILTKEGEIKKLAKMLSKMRDFFFIGRGLSYPIALEGALKLKEITYLHAEGYPAGELKHGPMSLLDKGVCVIAIAPEDDTTQKILSNIQECRARNATVVGFSDSSRILSSCDVFFRMPTLEKPLFSPIIYAVPLQMLSYYMAVLLGRDPDKPRNLAKSVTVE